VDETGNSQVADEDQVEEGQESPEEASKEAPAPQTMELALSPETWEAIARFAYALKVDGEALEHFIAAIGEGHTVSVVKKT
jgi:hypothetical protein